MADEIRLSSYLENFPAIDADKLLELLRELRQTTVLKSEQEANSKEVKPCLELIVKMFQFLEDGSVENVIDKFVLSVCSRVAVQFIGNTIVDNKENQTLLWSHSDKLKKIFQREDTKIKNYTSMVYYNLMLSNDEARMEMLEDEEFKFILLDEAILGLSEFPQFTVEKFLELNHFDKLYSNNIRLLHRLYILDMICSLLRADKGFLFDLKHVHRISEDFKKETEIILNGLKASPNNECSEGNDKQVYEGDPRLAVKLLSVLCSLSGDEQYQKIISEDTSLIVYVIYVLRALKMFEDNHKEEENSVCSCTVVIDFKGSLIRLLGNMCWKNAKNQNLVRENKCIELILECCKLDENNPFICEWSILAIKNLCDNNKENQEFIASIKPVMESDLAVLNRRLNMNLNLSEDPPNLS